MKHFFGRKSNIQRFVMVVGYMLGNMDYIMNLFTIHFLRRKRLAQNYNLATHLLTGKCETCQTFSPSLSPHISGGKKLADTQCNAARAEALANAERSLKQAYDDLRGMRMTILSNECLSQHVLLQRVTIATCKTVRGH